jgi:hypothetical protein
VAGREATYRSDWHSPLRRQRAAGLLCALFVLLSLLAATAPEAGAASPTLLLGGPHVGEFQPVRGDGFLAWQQNTQKNPHHYDLFARPLGGGTSFKVNASGTNGANGDIDGSQLVYQQFHRGKSDLKFFDLSDRQRSPAPGKVNTDQWEYWPTMSGDWLLFARLYGNDVRKIFLFNLLTKDSRLVGKVRGSNRFLAPGQVSGDYAVWSTCRSRTECDVVRYYIPQRNKQVIPNRGVRQHAASVTPDGTVYFARSRDCGNNVTLVRRSPEGQETVLWRLPSGDDVGSTKAYVDQQGVTSLYFDQFACGRSTQSDAWQIVVDTSPDLSVAIQGDGSGTVTVTPPGTQCGSVCTESYDLGTGVTLTAHPAGDSVFAGWGGACTGTSPTCALTMDGPKSVTATFTTKFVLSVSKVSNGHGTVTSSPPGIDCGTDCSQPYDFGTSVTLTANPDPDSVFGGWGGACSGMTLTCALTMNSNKTVTVTFNLKPQPQLIVAKAGSGTGTVTSSPAGIDCGTDCDERYNANSVVTLTANADVASVFTGWTNCDAVQIDNTCEMTMSTDKTVTATFDPII